MDKALGTRRNSPHRQKNQADWTVVFLNSYSYVVRSYLRHRDWTVNLAFRFTSDRELALDVLQETFLYLLKKFPGFALRAKFTTFLYPVIRNLALNARKKNQRYELVDDKLEELTEPVEPDVEENLEDQLRMVMGNLPIQQQEVLLLRFVDDHSLNEIAEILEIPPGTVKSRLHNALRALAENPRTKTYFEKE